MSSNKFNEDFESVRQRILQFLERYPNETFKSKELSRRLSIRTQKDEQAFRKALRSLQDERKILRIKGKKYSHLHIKQIIHGKLEITSRGFGIFISDSDGEEIYIHPDYLGNAVHGDKVEVSLFPQTKKQKERGARREGEIVNIIERGESLFVGTLEKAHKQFFVVPDSKRFSQEILISKECLNNAKENDKVVVKIKNWKGDRRRPEGEIIEVLGKLGELTAELKSIAREFHISAEFPTEVQLEAKSISDNIDQSEFLKRLDLRDLFCFTIDPADAKDYDDAISLEHLPDGNYKVGVHIADVSHFVIEGSSIDKEALKRGTSVYFPNGVIPMLPEKLSNKLCSLHPGEDRLTFTVFMNVSPRGSVKEYDIVESIIRSKKRYNYEQVQEVINLLQNNKSIPIREEQFVSIIHDMYKLSTVLTKKRMKEGSIDFDSAEVKFELNEKGEPIKIIKKERLDSHRLVEEFMLLANRIVAKHIGLAKKEDQLKPFIYRVHDSPDPDRIKELSAFVEKFGFKLNIDGGVTSKSLQRLLEQVKGTEVENVINEVALRSMAKAVYSERNIGHYGLAFDYYAHFTSPIRRYPDLAIHRILKKYKNGISLKERESLRKQLPHIAKQSSEMERLAMEAERAAVKVMQVEFMKRHLGDEFHAVISGVTHYGIFVELIDTLVEGMIHVRDLTDDYYIYDEKHYALKGRRTNKLYRLGDMIEVKVLRVDPEERRIDFVLVNAH